MRQFKMLKRPKRRHENISFPVSLLVVHLFFFAHASKIKAQSSIAFAGVDSLVDQAIDLVYQQQYFEAIKLCEQVIQDYPDNPLGYLGQAGVYHLLMLNYRVSLFDNAFDSLTTLAIETMEKLIKNYREDAKAYFVLGAAYGFRGLNRIRKGQWFSAFRDGVRGVSNIMKAHELDQNLYDTYYGLGLYYYWKSAKARVLTFLRLMKDEREKGIDYLRIAIEKGRFSSMEAVFALVEIYYYEDRYEEALTTCLSLKQKFINDPTWNYLTAKILAKLNRWEEAKNYFVTLLEMLETSTFKSYGYLAECHHAIAECNFNIGDYNAAREELNLAFEKSKLWDKDKEIEGPLLDFDKVLLRMKGLDQDLARLTSNQ